jgi:hypothetical protein
VEILNCIMLKKDNLPLGIVLGLVTPIVTFLLYYALVIVPNQHIGLTDFITVLAANRQMLSKMISICLLLNGVVFYLYTRQRRDTTAKGIFLVTMLYALVIIILKIMHG